jgi:uncharacterized membrane protein YfcA
MAPVLDFLGVVFLCSVVAGIFGSMLGLGGGTIIVPVLTLGLGIDIHHAIGAAIVSVIATSSGAAAAYLRDHLSNVRIGMFLEMATTAGAVSGAFLAGIVNSAFLYVIFALVLAYSAYMMYRRRAEEVPAHFPMGRWAKALHMQGEYYDPALERTVTYNVKGARVALPLMYVAGVVSGLLGIGSGVLKVPAMDIAMRLPMKVSTATSNFMIGVTAAASAGVYFARGDINPVIAGPVALGVLCGALIGTHWMMRARSSSLRKVFVIVLAVVSLQMLLKSVGVSWR